MKKTACLLAAAMTAGVGFANGYKAEEILSPAAEFSPGYFWMWKDRLDAGRLCGQLDDMYAHGIRSVCVHPFPKEFRPGYFQSEMSPDYLTPEYLAILKAVCEHAGKLGMNFWFYDEGGWPSGGAAGLVAKSDPEGRFQPWTIAPAENADGYAIARREQYGPGRESLPSSIEQGATERFIELTHEKVYAAMPEAFGREVKFTFMDEPEWQRNFYLPTLGWTADFAEVFKDRKGYDIRPFLKEILATYYGGADDALMAKRLDYCEVISDLFIERFMLPLRDWARKHGARSSGHLNGEDIPENGSRYAHGNLLKTLRAMDAPGVDVIWRQLYPNLGQGMEGSQMPFPRYAKSAANQIGSKYVMSESFGIYGASVCPGPMKWLVDFQMVRGVDMFVFGYLATSYTEQWMTLFEPQSGPVTPYWDFERPYFEYIHRVSALLADGETPTATAVYYDARAFFAGGQHAEYAGKMHRAAASLLDNRHLEYDFVDDDPIIGAELKDGALCIGPMRYRTLVVPSKRWMKPETAAKLEKFRAAGGRVLGIDGILDLPGTCEVTGKFNEILRVAKRVKGDEAMYFLVNEGPWARELKVRFQEKGRVVRFDPVEGRFYNVKTAADGSFDEVFDGYASAVYFVNTKLAAEDAPEFDHTWGYAAKAFQIKDGWTLRREKTYFAGKRELESRADRGEKLAIGKLGDWRGQLGAHFSGIASYEVEFDWDGEESVHELDLGKVSWTCRAEFNGEKLKDRFFGPFRWTVVPKKGRNRLVVTVANHLGNMLSDAETRGRIRREFYYPGIRNYEGYQEVFDRQDNEAGLMGPVILNRRVR